MKAYRIWDKYDSEKGQKIVFGNTVREVKRDNFCCDMFEDVEWTAFMVKREPAFDDMENLPPAEFAYERALEGWRYFDYYVSEPCTDECTKEEYIEWYKKTFEEEV
ncbi:hypothetical protein BG261_05470 [Floricoccus tropicus]|uniref:Uncharacterized protein n=1 Tax=Floricoccus tropicus TaxID=1859473 RepID=A0A1E8GKS5_9LACT|nr:hypothetical protein [Floricoccus tropicus]OFI48839.1 hypothetical protein BG261_05470 [Floricoccus tropicus]